MAQHARGPITHTCDWDEDCGAEFASRDDMERHQLEAHWQQQDGNTDDE